LDAKLLLLYFFLATSLVTLQLEDSILLLLLDIVLIGNV
jgi:hypothetical protein